jgi:hypothetical protein
MKNPDAVQAIHEVITTIYQNEFDIEVGKNELNLKRWEATKQPIGDMLLGIDRRKVFEMQTFLNFKEHQRNMYNIYDIYKEIQTEANHYNAMRVYQGSGRIGGQHFEIFAHYKDRLNELADDVQDTIQKYTPILLDEDFEQLYANMSDIVSDVKSQYNTKEDVQAKDEQSFNLRIYDIKNSPVQPNNWIVDLFSEHKSIRKKF